MYQQQSCFQYFKQPYLGNTVKNSRFAEVCENGNVFWQKQNCLTLTILKETGNVSKLISIYPNNILLLRPGELAFKPMFPANFKGYEIALPQSSIKWCFR